MRITEAQLRQIIREELIHETTLADVVPHEKKVWTEEPIDRTPHDIPIYADPLEYSTVKKTADRRREIKRLWNMHADHGFFQDPNKFFVWHNLGLYSGDNSLLSYFPPGSSKPGSVPGVNRRARDELSCFGEATSRLYHYDPSDGGSYFTFKERRVTFVSMDDAATERISQAKPEDWGRLRPSGLRKRPAPDIEFSAVPLDVQGIDAVDPIGEVVIDNWIIDTYFIVPPLYGRGWVEREIEYANKLGIKYEVL
jgi:hypothetical protein